MTVRTPRPTRTSRYELSTALLGDALQAARDAIVAAQSDAWAACFRLTQSLLERSRPEDKTLRRLARVVLLASEPARRLAALEELLGAFGNETSPHRVLLVDDDPDVHALIGLTLPEEWELEVASTLAEASERLEQGEHSLLLLDLDLPDGDGRQLLATKPWRSQLPVLIFSGQEDALSYTECLALGAEGFLRKPVDPRKLSATLRRTLVARSSSNAADPLTGLPTRNALALDFQTALATSRRTGDSLSLAIFDLDRFKAINDRHGHLAGDKLLKAYAAKASAELRGRDRLYRWGGDEFVALLPGASPGDARQACERVRLALQSSPVRLSPRKNVWISCSFGVADATNSSSLEAALARADQELYRNKALRRDSL